MRFLVLFTLALLTVVLPAESRGQTPRVVIEHSRIPTRAAGRLVVALRLDGAGRSDIGVLHGRLSFAASAVRYVGLVPDPTHAVLVNERAPGQLLVTVISIDKNGRGLADRIALLVFESRDGTGIGGIRYDALEAVGRLNYKNIVVNARARVQSGRSLPDPAHARARTLSSADWDSVFTNAPGRTSPIPPPSHGPAAIDNSGERQPVVVCNSPCYGDVAGAYGLGGIEVPDNAVNLYDALRVLKWSVGVGLPLPGFETRLGRAANPQPFNDTLPGKPHGFFDSGRCVARIEIADALTIVNYAVGEPGQRPVGERIPLDVPAYPSGCPGAFVNDSLGSPLNARGVLDRGDCLSVSIVTDVAYECGDLRVTHALPGVRTLGATRAPTLLYSSQHHDPFPRVTVEVSAGGDPGPLPDSTVYNLYVADVERSRESIPASVWSTGRTKRIQLGWSALADTTGVYRYKVVARVFFNGVASPDTVVATDEVIVVNRRNTPYGAGWWLSGLERLYRLQDSTKRLWVGGDGSARVYNALSTFGNVWVADAFDRPDTLVLVSATGQYERTVRGGAKVVFDAQGRHVRTRDPRGYETQFTYHPTVVAGESPLATISVPRLGTPYLFEYGLSGDLLHSVQAPSNIGAPRSVTLSHSGRDVTTIGDANGTVVNFIYNNNQMQWRQNRRVDLTIFTFDALRSLIRTDAAGRVTTICGLYSRSGPCGLRVLAPDDAAITIDGPRTDVADTTRVSVDRFGAPSKVVAANGATTVFTRSSEQYPAFVTRIVAADNTVSTAVPDARGNVASVTVENLAAGYPSRTTSFLYDPRWDAPTRILRPEGDSTTFGYDELTGNRLFSRIGARTTQYIYGGSGNALGLLQDISYPGSRGGAFDRDQLIYDGLGNVVVVNELTDSLVAGRVNASMRMQQDAIGQTVLSCQLLQLSGEERCTRTAYDLAGRDTLVVDSAAALSGTGAQWVRIRKFYDAEDNPTLVERTPSSGPVGVMTTGWEYNAFGQATREWDAVDGTRRTSTYDAAGNLDALTTPRGVQTHTYDALNRLSTRTVQGRTWFAATPSFSLGSMESPMRPYPDPDRPGGGAAYTIPEETMSYEYDIMGRVRLATTPDTRVERTYNAAGQVLTDVLSIRGATPGVFKDYALAHEYDLNGRRRVTTLPTSIVNGAPNTSITRSYDPTTGDLTTIRDALGLDFTYTYTPRGQPQQLEYANGRYRQRMLYDALGNIARDSLWFGGTVLRASRFTYDARSKRLTTDDAVGLQESYRFAYSGLGHLVSSRMRHQATPVGGGPLTIAITGEVQTNDPFGNRLTTVTADTLRGAVNRASRTTRSLVYTPNTGRLLGYAPSPAPPAFTYDGSGDQIFEQTGSGAQVVNRASYYDAAGQLRAVDARTQGSFAVGSTAYVFEQYRYDALGRRVWVRTDRRCDASVVGQNAPVCDQSTLRRVVWDGAQILAEVQVPVKLTASSTELPASDQDNDLYLPRLVPYFNGKDPNPFFGRVLYTHGLALDQPLAITRLGYVDNFQGSAATHVDFPAQTIALFWTAQGYLGNAGCGTGSAGQACRATNSAGRSATMAVGLTALHFAYERPRTDTSFFQGSLLRDQRDATGTLYRRNRTYDPASGRFTQEDPIGLSGGLNLYGFAGGDPVNFSDPFGLCPYVITGKPCGTGTAIGVGFVPIFGDAVDIVGALSGRDLLTGENIGAVGAGVTIAGTILGSGKLAREAVGAVSTYADVTKRGSRFWNRATNVDAVQFGQGLTESGFARVNRAGGITIYTKGDRRYVVRGPERSSSGSSADVYIRDELQGKIRLGRQ